MNPTLYLFRHVSGAGSSTLANQIQTICDIADISCRVFSADQYFEQSGEYKFDATKLGQAHNFCFNNAEEAMKKEISQIIITNTFTTEKEIKPYVDLAGNYGYTLVSLIVENRHGGKNTHNVPDFVLERQLSKLTDNIKLK